MLKLIRNASNRLQHTIEGIVRVLIMCGLAAAKSLVLLRDRRGEASANGMFYETCGSHAVAASPAVVDAQEYLAGVAK